MENQIDLKDRIKVQVTLIILYIISEVSTFSLLLDKGTLGKWKSEGIKIFVITGISCTIILLSINIKKFNRRKNFCYLGGLECIMFSLLVLYTILEGYYNLYEKIGMEILYIYVAVIVVLFLLNRNFYKKLPTEEELNKRKKVEPQKGFAYFVAASTLGAVRHLSMEEQYVVNVVLSLVICCGWLALGWFMFQGTKVYIKDNNSETGKKDSVEV